MSSSFWEILGTVLASADFQMEEEDREGLERSDEYVHVARYVIGNRGRRLF